MNNDRDLMQETLDALTYVGDKDIYSDTIDALRARLEKPEREWVRLTHEEHMEILTRDLTAPSRIAVTEAKLKEKNT